MKHFQDHLAHVSSQTLNTAVIVDSKGEQRGSVIVRYTKSTDGYNNETGVCFYYGDYQLDYTKTIKGSRWMTGGLYELLSEHKGIKILDWHKREFYTFNNKPKNRKEAAVMTGIDGISQPSEMRYIKIGNAVFSILWV